MATWVYGLSIVVLVVIAVLTLRVLWCPSACLAPTWRQATWCTAIPIKRASIVPKVIYTEVQLPEIVRKAHALVNQIGFPLMPASRPVGSQGPPFACIPEVGRLLQVLAAPPTAAPIVTRLQ
jgi:hypothetical protein